MLARLTILAAAALASSTLFATVAALAAQQ